MYLLDTDIISNLLTRAPSPALTSKLVSAPPRQQFTSSISIGEVVYGACRWETRRNALLERLESRILLNLPVLPFDLEAARQYGEIRAELERRGSPIGDPDVQIAAIALSRNLTVVTGNVRHFSRIPGLKVENWLQE